MELNERYKMELLDSIPVVRGMKIEIDNISSNSITVGAPLGANINYEGSAFGGSLNTVCILSCYILVHHILKNENVQFESLVIQDSKVKYLKPVKKDFFAIAYVSDANKEKLLKMLKKKKRGRIAINSFIRTGGIATDHVIFEARFVVTA